MEWSVSAFEAVGVMSLPVWLIVEGVLASLRLPGRRRGKARRGGPEASREHAGGGPREGGRAARRLS